jgi:hypothetical protein
LGRISRPAMERVKTVRPPFGAAPPSTPESRGNPPVWLSRRSWLAVAAAALAISGRASAASESPLCDWFSGVGEAAQALSDGRPDRSEAAARRALDVRPHGAAAARASAALGLALRDQGWRITLLGADTPIDTMIATAQTLRQDMTVVAFVLGKSLDASRAELGRLARHTPLVLAGPGATAAIADGIGATYVNGDPVWVARRLTDDRPVVAAGDNRPGRTRRIA